MSDIFVCYSKTDRAIATQLGQRLRDEGWSVFIDRHIDAGHRWSEEIESQLAAARAVLTLWSSSSLRSRFVLDEAHDAADRGIIFPARIEEVTVPYGFRQFQTPDLIGWDGLGDREEWQR
ncbi:MAG: toll/interleukin-1 receptor domain-containing protein, partial [Gammaproteobacteria bacterium]